MTAALPGHTEAASPHVMNTYGRLPLALSHGQGCRVWDVNGKEYIDALGGITVHTSCVQSDINGGRRNGGYSLRLRAGENHINGRQALALARTLIARA